MNVLKQLIFAFALVIGLSVAASAQKDGQKKPPPKDPPVINVPQKPPRENPPRGNDGNKPKKPGYSLAIAVEPSKTEIA